MTASIVYGFQINNASPDILACRGRRQPSGCYTIEIAFPDLYKNVNQKKAEQKKAEQNTAHIDPLTEELKSYKVDPQEANPKLGEFKTTTYDYPLINLVISASSCCCCVLPC